MVEGGRQEEKGNAERGHISPMNEEEEEEKTGESQQPQIDCRETPLCSSAVAFRTLMDQHLVCRFGALPNKNQGTQRWRSKTVCSILQESQGRRLMRGWRHLVSHPAVYSFNLSFS